MAAIRVPSSSFLETFIPIARAQLLPNAAAPTRRIPLLQRLRLSPLLPAALAPIPTLLEDLWDGLLKAVPKKKTSHMKKRHRQMASGKHLKDVTALNKCSACGRLKRAHILCPYCVQSIRQWMGNGFKTKNEVKEHEKAEFETYNESRRARGMTVLDPPEEKEGKGDEANA